MENIFQDVKICRKLKLCVLGLELCVCVRKCVCVCVCMCTCMRVSEDKVICIQYLSVHYHQYSGPAEAKGGSKSPGSSVCPFIIIVYFYL